MVGNDQRPVIHGVHQLVVGHDVHGGLAVRQLAFGQIGVLVLQGRGHVGQTQAEAVQWKVGSTSTRTAGKAPPPTVTWPTPSICNSRCSMNRGRRVIELAAE